MRCAKELHLLNYCSHKMNKFLIQIINLACAIHAFYLLSQFIQYTLQVYNYFYLIFTILCDDDVVLFVYM